MNESDQTTKAALPSHQQSSRTLPRLADKNAALQGLIRHLAATRLPVLDQQPIEVLEHPHPDDFVYGSHLSVIQIASRELRVTFKSHFKLSDTELLTQKNASHRSADQVLTSTYDFFMEYSNLVAGGLKKVLYKSHITAGISLPMATSGFDELIASDLVRDGSYFDFWIMQGPLFRFTCSVSVSFLNEDKVFTFAIEDAQDENEGELEIL